jgi:hypothetical protein
VCFQRPFARVSVPGCVDGQNDLTIADFCISSPTPRPTPGPHPPSPQPTRAPQSPIAAPVSAPVAPVSGSQETFTLRLYWERGYCWQEDCDEIFWCAYYNYDRSYCYYNNEEDDDCEEDRMYIDSCNFDEYWDHKFRFLFLDGGEAMIQTEFGNNCWARYGRRIYLETCENSSRQRWYAPNGSFSGSRFEISQAGTDLCVSQNHHPKQREVIEMHTCEDARDDDTSYWTRY